MKKPHIDEFFNIEQVVQAMNQHYPESTKKRRDAKTYYDIARTYKKEVVHQLHFFSRYEYQYKFDQYNISFLRLRKIMGRYSPRQLFWREWFDQQPFSLYKIVNIGSNLTETMTVVNINFDLASAQELVHWDKDTILEYFPYGEIGRDIDGYWDTDIDMASLSAYIKSSMAAIDLGVYNKNTGTWTRLKNNQLEVYKENLKTAIMIKTLTNDKNEFRQGVKISEFGRYYYKGVNLQNCHKIVRTAALGQCHSYDLSSASQSWRLYECQKLNPGLMYSYTRELLLDKQTFRRTLAAILKTRDLDLAKKILNSIGFGANFNDSAWPTNDGAGLPALRKLLSLEQITSLQNNAWFMGFVNEQQVMNQLIYDNFKKTFSKKEYPKHVLDAGGSIVKNKVLAWLYQEQEKNYLTTMHDYIELKSSKKNILLLVHDGVYVRHSIDQADLTYVLQQLNPYLKLEHDIHNAYTFEDVFGILEHKKHLKEEHAQALRYQIARLEHMAWNDREYRSCWALFSRDYDRQLDQTLWTDQEQQEYQKLKDKYYETWWKEIIVPNKLSVISTIKELQ
jgi:hypothetical protein